MRRASRLDFFSLRASALPWHNVRTDNWDHPALHACLRALLWPVAFSRLNKKAVGMYVFAGRRGLEPGADAGEPGGSSLP